MVLVAITIQLKANSQFLNMAGNEQKHMTEHLFKTCLCDELFVGIASAIKSETLKKKLED